MWSAWASAYDPDRLHWNTRHLVCKAAFRDLNQESTPEADPNSAPDGERLSACLGPREAVGLFALIRAIQPAEKDEREDDLDCSFGACIVRGPYNLHGFKGFQ
jgi:hypothetical protein